MRIHTHVRTCAAMRDGRTRLANGRGKARRVSDSAGAKAAQMNEDARRNAGVREVLKIVAAGV